jgi:hypothetical protein
LGIEKVCRSQNGAEELNGYSPIGFDFLGGAAQDL